MSSLRRVSFSRVHLIVFAVIFGLLGIIVWRSLAATTCSGPINITAGGTYTGCWESTDSTPTVTISTTQPVIINNSTIRNLTGNDMIRSGYAVDLTLDNNQVIGGNTYQTSGRFVNLDTFKNLVVTNNSIENTTGIEADIGVTGSTIKILKNRHHNIQGAFDSNNNIIKLGNFVQFRVVQNSSIEVAWNEVVNEYNQSSPEDIISVYHTANAYIHDNMLWHQSVPGNDHQSSQGGITIDCSDRTGDPCNGNRITNNQVVDGVGVAIYAPRGGDNNLAQGNRIVSDGFLPNGQQKASGWNGLAVIPGGSNNHAHGNIVGYMNRYNGRCDWCGNTINENLNGAPEGGDGEALNNTRLPDPINSSTEQAEWTLWQQKLTTNNITIGATAGTTPAPTVNLSANPLSISPGGGSTISWSSTNATYCTASGGWTGSNLSASGSQTVTPTATTIYNLSCTGAGGTVSATPVTITVSSSSAGEWIYCAAEHQFCSFSGTTNVRYGIDGAYTTKTLSNGTQCDNTAFIDPAPGADKHCDYQSSTTKLGDLDGNGTVDVTDLSMLLSKFGTADTVADIDKSGMVDVTDLSILLSHFGS